MAIPTPEERAITYVEVTRQHFATYHHHKEQMAYVVIAFYLAGVSALIASNNIQTQWAAIASHCVMLYATTAFSFTVAVFVGWQLWMRRRSAIIVAACDHLRAQWLTHIPSLDTTIDCYWGLQLPRFLRDEISRTPHSGPTALLVGVPVVFAVLWHIILLLCLAHAYGSPRLFPFSCILECSNHVIHRTIDK